MAFVQSFTVSSILGRPSVISFLDTSSGTDPNIVKKHIFLLKSDGTYLTPTDSTTDYIVWPTASNPFLLDILPKDMAISIQVGWYIADTHIIFDNTFNNSFN